ncbi:MAG: hypothetical protein MHPSP_001652 [Paramarteilia canceri]
MVKVTSKSKKHYIGELVCFDKYTNLIIANTTEYRNKHAGKGKKPDLLSRVLGLIFLPGYQVHKIALHGIAPKDDPLSVLQFPNQGHGMTTVANRGMIPTMNAMPAGQIPGLQGQMLSANPQMNPIMPPPVFPSNMAMPAFNMPPPMMPGQMPSIYYTKFYNLLYLKI